MERDFNRTFEVTPDTVRGGALLIHGLTDGPYSMRAIAEQLRAEGFYSLALAHARPRHRAGGARHEHRR